MIARLTLDGTAPIDQFAWTLLQQAFRARGGVPIEQQKLTKAERRQDAAINRALELISVPGEGTAPKSGFPDPRIRELKPEAVTLEMELPEFERLVKFYDADTMIWSTFATGAAEDFGQRLSAALAGASDDKKPAGPRLSK